MSRLRTLGILGVLSVSGCYSAPGDSSSSAPTTVQASTGGLNAPTMSNTIPTLAADTGPLIYSGAMAVSGTLLLDDNNCVTLNGQPLVWPSGFSAVQAGDHVEVLAADGVVVATLGDSVFLGGNDIQSDMQPGAGYTELGMCVAEFTEVIYINRT